VIEEETPEERQNCQHWRLQRVSEIVETGVLWESSASMRGLGGSKVAVNPCQSLSVRESFKSDCGFQN
jgi:hypothetical protein